MASNERLRGVQVHRPIIYGSHARLLSEQEKESAPAGHTHRWTVFLTSATSPPPDPPKLSNDGPPEIDMDYLPGGADDLSYLLKKVTFRLHETYANPSRVFDRPPFQVTETGWGEFTVTIRVQFVPESGEKPMTLAHPIKLHHWGPPIEPPPAATASDPVETEGKTAGETGTAEGTGSAVPTPNGTPAPGSIPASSDDKAGEEKEEDVKMEDPPVGSTSTPTPASAPIDPNSAAPDPNTETPASPLEPSVIVAQPQTQTISIAQKYPVHSWQYDELVFTDPTVTFLELMNAHPPIPLPAKNRRARDQREEYDSREGSKKGKKARQSLGPGPGHGSAVKGLMSKEGGPIPGEKERGLGAIPPVGIPGEPGSADVPLEFSHEMEKGEWNRLNEARVRIVEEMDSWRERLIAQEKELVRLKEEMKV